MESLRGIILCIRKDFRIELRKKFAIGGLLVYVLSTVFIVYVSVITFEPAVWNVLFWIIFVFVAINAVLKSFMEESHRQYLYYYTLISPLQLLIAKWIYNVLLLFGLALTLAAALILVGGNHLEEVWIFMLSLVLGSLAIAGCLTVISSIAIKADNSAVLMAILSFPVLIPILLSLMKMSSKALGLLPGSSVTSEVMTLSSLILLLLGLGLLLFPYLWKS